ncbi:MAG: histidine phosphatase family protein, partial [Vicinamibacterales bacterium]
MNTYDAADVSVHLKGSRSCAATCTILLVRHAHTDAIGRVLTGRLPEIPLSARGHAQAERVGSALRE